MKFWEVCMELVYMPATCTAHLKLKFFHKFFKINWLNYTYIFIHVKLSKLIYIHIYVHIYVGVYTEFLKRYLFLVHSMNEYKGKGGKLHPFSNSALDANAPAALLLLKEHRRPLNRRLSGADSRSKSLGFCVPTSIRSADRTSLRLATIPTTLSLFRW